MKRKNILIKILILAITFVMSMTAFGCSNGGNEALATRQTLRLVVILRITP